MNLAKLYLSAFYSTKSNVESSDSYVTKNQSSITLQARFLLSPRFIIVNRVYVVQNLFKIFTIRGSVSFEQKAFINLLFCLWFNFDIINLCYLIIKGL